MIKHQRASGAPRPLRLQAFNMLYFHRRIVLIERGFSRLHGNWANESRVFTS